MLWPVLLCAVVLGTTWPAWLNPGYFSHDELAYLQSPFSIGGPDSQLGSSFFRPLGVMLIWAVVNCSPTPQVAHLLAVLLHFANVLIFQQGIHKAGHANHQSAALLFAVSPLAAFSVGWTAALFDMGWVACGLLAWVMLQSLTHTTWRRLHLVGIATLYACALLFKETALTVPCMLAAWMLVNRMKPQRIHYAAFGLMALVTALYLWARFAHLSDMAHRGSGGYGLASWPQMERNVVAYWVFAIVPKLVEVQQVWSSLGNGVIAAASLLHFAVVFLLCGRNWQRLGCYVLFFYLPLLPVLVISKHETQYLYATGATSAACLAHVKTDTWKRWAIALFIALSAYHANKIYRAFQRDGQCQSAFLSTLTLPVLPPSHDSVVRFWLAPQARQWVIQRALVHTPALVFQSLHGVVVRAKSEADLFVDASCKVSEGPVHPTH